MNLEELRNEKGLTKAKVAEELKVHETTYGKWENEKETIPTERLITLSEYYEVSIDYIVGLSNNKYVDRIKEEEEELEIKGETQKEKLKRKSKERIKEIRKEQKESLREFAKELNTTCSTIHGYETGKTLILGSFLIEISKKYNYSIDWILGRSDKKYRK